MTPIIWLYSYSSTDMNPFVLGFYNLITNWSSLLFPYKYELLLELLSDAYSGIRADSTGIIANSTGIIDDSTGIRANGTDIIADITGIRIGFRADCSGIRGDSSGIKADEY